MALGNTKTSNFIAVINDIERSKTNMLKTLKNLSKLNDLAFYAYIIHDSDKLSDNTLKTLHAHIVFITYQKQTKQQALSMLSNCLEIDKKLISLEITNNVSLCVQYLTHKNDQNKHQYNFKEIATNDANKLESLYNQVYRSILTEQDIFEYLKSSETTTELIEKIGLDKALKYDRLFEKIRAEKKENIKKLLERYEAIRNLYSSLLTAIENTLTEEEKLAINYSMYIEYFRNLN